MLGGAWLNEKQAFSSGYKICDMGTDTYVYRCVSFGDTKWDFRYKGACIVGSIVFGKCYGKLFYQHEICVLWRKYEKVLWIRAICTVKLGGAFNKSGYYVVWYKCVKRSLSNCKAYVGFNCTCI